MENNFEVRSQLARLLSKENISVIHGEYRTAFFDVQNRTLGLPNWKNRGKDVYDLLVGHEVGHALFTPVEGWHDSDLDVQGIPRSFLNIIEDIRIERKVQAQYPGLIGSFKRGYSVLFNENFFGTDDRNVDAYKFIDRINLKSKLGDLIDVQFSKDELPLFNRAMAVETWNDVVAVAKDILEFMQEQKNKEPKQDKNKEGIANESDDDESMDPNGTGDTGREDDRSDASDSEATGSDQESPDQTDSQDGSDEIEPQHAEEASREDQSSVITNGDEGGFESETDASFRLNESDLIEEPAEGTPYNVNGISRSQADSMLISYDRLREARADSRANERRYYSSDEVFEKELQYRQGMVNNAYLKYVADNKKVLNLMVKEFESRKAAFQYSRASTAKTGSLDVNKLHTYKYNDDIFAKVTRLADAKSHGLVMYVDYSGSMGDVIGNVLKQTLLLATFCKRVNIPFDVYGFTAHSAFEVGRSYDLWGDISVHNVGILHLLSSSMSKAQYNEAFMSLFGFSVMRNSHSSRFELMAATPLNQVAMAAHYHIDDFRAKHKVDKVVAVFLTDGAANRMEFGSDRRYKDNTFTREHRGVNIRFQGKTYNGNSPSGLTTQLMENLQKSRGVITVGIHLAEQLREARSFLWNRMPYDKQEELIKQYRRERSAHSTKVRGFNSVFLISARAQDLQVKDDEFSVDSDASNRVLKNSFMKFAKSKKNNRVVMSAFAAAIA